MLKLLVAQSLLMLDKGTLVYSAFLLGFFESVTVCYLLACGIVPVLSSLLQRAISLPVTVHTITPLLCVHGFVRIH